MKKNLIALFLALVMLTVGFGAVAEEPTRVRGNYPERGITLALTEADEAMGLVCSFYVAGTDEIAQLPVFEIKYTDVPTFESVFSKYADVDPEATASEELFLEMLFDLLSCTQNIAQIALFETPYITEKMATDPEFADLEIIGENDGYTYVLLSDPESLTYDSPEMQERVNTAVARVDELIKGITFQPIVFAEGEFTEAPDVFPAFETQDINGNTVTNEIFKDKDLTVVNIWGTFCNPCVEEMPLLAAWSAEMPENVQIIGLVSDLNSANDMDVLEMAQAICEATGADVYTHLIANADFEGLLSNVIGVPTTLFVDGMGNVVGEPVVGANVPLCQKIANDLLNAQ